MENGHGDENVHAMNGDVLIDTHIGEEQTHSNDQDEQVRVPAASITYTPATPLSDEEEDIHEFDTNTQTSTSPPSKGIVEAAYDDLLGDYGEGIAPKAEVEDDDDLSTNTVDSSQVKEDISESDVLEGEIDEEEQEVPRSAEKEAMMVEMKEQADERDEAAVPAGSAVSRERHSDSEEDEDKCRIVICNRKPVYEVQVCERDNKQDKPQPSYIATQEVDSDEEEEEEREKAEVEREKAEKDSEEKDVYDEFVKPSYVDIPSDIIEVDEEDLSAATEQGLTTSESVDSGEKDEDAPSGSGDLLNDEKAECEEQEKNVPEREIVTNGLGDEEEEEEGEESMGRGGMMLNVTDTSQRETQEPDISPEMVQMYVDDIARAAQEELLREERMKNALHNEQSEMDDDEQEHSTCPRLEKVKFEKDHVSHKDGRHASTADEDGDGGRHGAAAAVAMKDGHDGYISSEEERLVDEDEHSEHMHPAAVSKPKPEHEYISSEEERSVDHEEHESAHNDLSKMRSSERCVSISSEEDAEINKQAIAASRDVDSDEGEGKELEASGGVVEDKDRGYISSEDERMVECDEHESSHEILRAEHKPEMNLDLQLDLRPEEGQSHDKRQHASHHSQGTEPSEVVSEEEDDSHIESHSVEHYKSESFEHHESYSPKHHQSHSPARSASPEPQDDRSDEMPVSTHVRIEDTLSDFQPSKRYVKPEEPKRGSSNAPGVIIMELDQGASGDMMCKLCEKRVYEMEKIMADKGVYHKSCFKCTHCKRILSLGNFASIDGQLYCKPHFLELFKTKENSLQATHDDSTSFEIARAEDKVEDGLESIPSIKNIKSRFEGAGGSPAQEYRSRSSHSPEVRRSPTNGHDVDSIDQYERGSRPPSKWDQPKAPPPPPVNRVQDEEQEEDEDTGENAKAAFSRFREIERGESSSYDRKPVHKITPPREELAEGIRKYQETQQEVDEEQSEIVRSGAEEVREEEMPPAQYTKTMLARFKSLEDVNKPVSPARTTTTTTTKRTTITTQYSKPSPDSGISDSEGQHVINGSHRSDDEGDAPTREVIRSEDANETQELPEQGFTKSLLAQWRSKEQETNKFQATPEHKTRSPARSWSRKSSNDSQSRHTSESPARAIPKQVHTPDSELSSPDEHGYETRQPRVNGTHSPVREVVRSGDRKEEDELPPPSFTRNMLAKFQSLQEEAQRDATVSRSPAKKPSEGQQQFKWTVKEATPLHTPHSGRTERHRASTNGSSHEDEYDNHSDGRLDESFEHEERTTEEELPPAAYTKSMLDKFKSLEDTSSPAPTPELSNRRMKQASTSLSPGPGRKFPSTTVPVYTDEREQPDGLEQSQSSQEGYYKDYDSTEGGEYENEPELNPNVVRETDNAGEEELPEQGTTRNLLAKFQSLQAN